MEEDKKVRKSKKSESQMSKDAVMDTRQCRGFGQTLYVIKRNKQGAVQDITGTSQGYFPARSL